MQWPVHCVLCIFSLRLWLWLCRLLVYCAPSSCISHWAVWCEYRVQVSLPLLTTFNVFLYCPCMQYMFVVCGCLASIIPSCSFPHHPYTTFLIVIYKCMGASRSRPCVIRVSHDCYWKELVPTDWPLLTWIFCKLMYIVVDNLTCSHILCRSHNLCLAAVDCCLIWL